MHDRASHAPVASNASYDAFLTVIRARSIHFEDLPLIPSAPSRPGWETEATEKRFPIQPPPKQAATTRCCCRSPYRSGTSPNPTPRPTVVLRHSQPGYGPEPREDPGPQSRQFVVVQSPVGVVRGIQQVDLVEEREG